MYRIVDSQTGQQIGKLHQARGTATRRADKLDNEYGAYRYRVDFVDHTGNRPHPDDDRICDGQNCPICSQSKR